MDFRRSKFEIKTVVTKEFFNNGGDLIYGGYVIHHSHVTGGIIGYAAFAIKRKEKTTTSSSHLHTIYLALIFSLL